jgi:hypothetical protein
VKGGETCLDGEKSSRPRSEEPVPGTKKSPRWSVRKALFVTTKARLSALHLPSKRGDQLKAQLAQRREDEKPWLFEI